MAVDYSKIVDSLNNALDRLGSLGYVPGKAPKTKIASDPVRMLLSGVDAYTSAKTDLGALPVVGVAGAKKADVDRYNAAVQVLDTVGAGLRSAFKDYVQAVGQGLEGNAASLKRQVESERKGPMRILPRSSSYLVSNGLDDAKTAVGYAKAEVAAVRTAFEGAPDLLKPQDKTYISELEKRLGNIASSLTKEETRHNDKVDREAVKADRKAWEKLLKGKPKGSRGGF
ncbi:MAG: hypothetical protein HYT71_01300 [Candidatus Aenigmarchaeota archaeon]|nr:hypothetical protein [Candidatus Aenigmarchaeota archaeon]